MSDQEKAAEALRAFFPGLNIDTAGNYARVYVGDDQVRLRVIDYPCDSDAPWRAAINPKPSPGDGYSDQRGATSLEALLNARTVTVASRRREAAKLRREAAALEASADALDALRIVDAEVVK